MIAPVSLCSFCADNSNPPANVVGELVAVGWPSWLAAVCGEALKGWLPRRADTFQNLGKASRDIQTGKVVALKRIQCDTSDPESVKIMGMEIVILRRLDHPNVVKLEGIVTSRMSETLYLVFEYMDHDLAALSGDPAMQFTETQVKHYMHQLFCGLKYCHEHQVLHRDLKGSDLLLDNNGVLKIADFGSASFFDLVQKQPMTNRVATYWYRAPELLLGATEYGVGVDLWSAGCILAGLLAKGPILAGHTEVSHFFIIWTSYAEQLQKIYALCGSPPDEYWKKYNFPLETLYRPRIQSRRCLIETFKDFPPSSLSLLNALFSVDPAKRPSAASALKSKFLSEVSQADESQSTKVEYSGSSKRNTTGLGKQKDNVKRSVVWNHFTSFVDDDGKKKCRCNYCASIFGTSMLRVHMKSCASNPSNQSQTQLNLTVATTKVEDTGKTKVGLLSWRFDQQVATKAIIEMLITDKLPFKFVENEGFRRCMELCQPALVVPSTSTITRDFYELFLDEKAKLKTQLSQSTLRICLTIDTWTSLQKNHYLCLTAHFIDNNWRLQKKVINFCPILSLKGRDIGKAVEVCLVDWGLENIFTITIDNASSNDTAIQYIKRKCKSNLCVLKGKWTHVRCMTRLINLVVYDMIKKMYSSVDSVREAVRYVTQTPATFKKFKELAKLEKVECQKSLFMDVPTQWSSTYLMLSVAIKYERAFDRLEIEDFVFRNDLGEQPQAPSSFDWDNVKRLVGFLQHYYQFTLKVSGTKYTTSNTFLDSVSCIHSVLKECFSSEDRVLMEISSSMKKKLDKYWGEIDKFNLLVFIASVFDPRTKLLYLEVTLCNMYGDDDGGRICALCKSALYELFNDYKRIHSDERVRNMPSSSHQSSNSLDRSLPDVDLFHNVNDVIKELRENNLAEVKRRKAGSGVTNDPKSELDRYLTEEIEEDNDYFQSEDFTVLDWWKTRSTTFPVLSLVARDVLAIPISTVACESSFATKGRVLDSFITSLTPETIQALLCYQDWIRSSDVPVNVEEHIRELDYFNNGKILSLFSYPSLYIVSTHSCLIRRLATDSSVPIYSSIVPFASPKYWLAAVSGEALKGWAPRTFKNLGKANHPSVVKLEGTVKLKMSESLYLVFEYMDHSLAALPADNAKQFTEPQISFTGKYVLHHDLKGSDHLLNKNGVRTIADFGSASFFGLVHEQPMTNVVAS
ncbi:hypothetical protein M8C21_022551 [Ambrosia artemisiifolia]|uniref:Protein kinase domain-containing protein n=1 Tax=Ambrosia artemisiifolia TaxID=4212 RepID=A0AAD5GNS2_AMBAR|nr:hypothetical protein M8C21_022551 [Ambrosia artemisiifolia]